jgi:simple sugar transport system permease protein
VLLLLAIGLSLGGFDVSTAMGAMVSGALGTPAVFASTTLVRATPLLITGLAVALAFRAGIINLGGDGQLQGGAAVAAAIGLTFANAPPVLVIPLMLIGGALGGVSVAVIPAWLRRRGVLEVITTIMMNFVVLYLVGYLVRGPLQEPTGVYPQSAPLSGSLRLPFVIPGTRLHLGFPLAAAGAVGLWWFFRSTAAGFRVRVAGANPRAAEVAGQVRVGRLTFRVFLVSGAMAGVAGAVEVSGVTLALYDGAPGYGFTAIAVALLAGLHPLGVVASAVFLGGLAGGAAAMQREAGVPAVLVSVLEALVILGVIGVRAVAARRSTAGVA